MDDHVFMKRFKKHIGLTLMQYRNIKEREIDKMEKISYILSLIATILGLCVPFGKK